MKTGLKISILVAGLVLLTVLIVIYQSERKAAALTVQMLYYPSVDESLKDYFWQNLSGRYQDSVRSLQSIPTSIASFQSMLDSLDSRWSTAVIRQMYFLQAGGALESYATPSCISQGEEKQLWGSAKAYFKAFYELRMPDMIYNGKHFPVDLDSVRHVNKHWRDMFRKSGFIKIDDNIYKLDNLTQFELAFIINHLRYAGAQVERSYMAPPAAALDSILQHQIKDHRHP